MGQKTWVSFTIFFLIIIQLIDIQAQNIEKSIVLRWQDPLVYEQSDDEKIALLYFLGAISAPDHETLPAYFEMFPMASANNEYAASLTDAQYAPMSPDEIALIPREFQQSEIAVSVKTAIEKKKPYAEVTLVPIRKNGSQYEKLVSATLHVRVSAQKSEQKTRTYAANSVLQSGNWFKVSTQNTGIHKVTFADLSAAGAGSQGIPSSQIAIFGNGGGMLPEANAALRYDDLQELPIEMHDGGDGIFNSGDYFLFYAEGPHSWTFNSETQQFNHNFNIYSDLAYYFVNTDAGIGSKRRIASVDNSGLAPTATADTYIYYGFHEVDSQNLGEGGRAWVGDKYDATTSYTYTLSMPAVPLSARLSVSAFAASARTSAFAVKVNGSSVGSVSVAALYGSDLAESATRSFSISSSTASPTVELSYNKPTSSSVGYLDYLEWQGVFSLRKGSSQMQFVSPDAPSANTVNQFRISNMSAGVKVWDVTVITEVHALAGTLNGERFTFNAPNEVRRKFVAFSDGECYAVNPVGRVGNQNLHGTSQVDMVIVSHPDFVSQAERLAQFRRSNDGLSVLVVTPQQVYNEFSSGSQDVSAIRDYMRMIYDKSEGAYPSYLLLFGRPSYDYRGIEGTCKLYVPNYEGNTAVNHDAQRSTDDYFGLLDENEGATGTLDIAVGRFPVTTLAQAKTAVDKTINYASQSILGAGTPQCNFGDWKNIATFVGDDEDGGTHLRTADALAQTAGTQNANINLEKIYLDAYQQVTYSSSARYPEVNAAINNRMNTGCLLFNYVGHGGKNGWATERIVELSDIQRWRNRYNQPWMLTLTCEFGWYDRSLTSPAEMVFLNENGGAAGLVTTSRVAFSGSNHSYGIGFYNNAFCTTQNRPRTLGEIHRAAKNVAGGSTGSTFMLYVMGDPAMKLAVPQCVVVTDSINGMPVAEFSDTLKALSRVSVSGHIEDKNGNFLSDFSGGLYPSIYDKKQMQGTLQNDQRSPYIEFEVQKNILFKGNATIRDGRFNFAFILPKDINYDCAPGKFSYYAYSSSSEASGAYSSAVIGGLSDESIRDDKGPEIELYMNDEQFVSGGIVTPSPTLIVKLKDEYGINTTGNGIGHDLVAILDDGAQVVLNSYYEAVRDSFNCGTVRYPYEKLEVGRHKLKVRAWDILNNPSEQEIEFNVASDEALKIDHVLNYPNPFTTHTDFYFEHNQPGVTLDILITIYTISGKVVRTIETTQCNEGFRCNPIPWDGRDDFGDKIGRGTYLYRLKVRTPDGSQAEKVEKIVIL